MMFFGCVAKMVKNHAGLYSRNSAGGINLKNLRHVLGEIENDSDVAALASERCAGTSTKEWRAELAAESDRRKNIVKIPGKNHSDRNLTVVGAIGRVKSASATIKADFALNPGSQGIAQSGGINESGLRRWRRDLIRIRFNGYKLRGLRR